MIIERFFMWPLIILCYGVLGFAVYQFFFGGLSGFVALAVWFLIPIGVPSLVGYVGYLWRRNLLKGVGRAEATICVLFPGKSVV